MSSRHPRRLLAALAALALTVVGLCTAAPAQAHDHLKASTPGYGETVTSSPAAVTLEYSGAIQADGALVTVTDTTGVDQVSGPLELSGSTVTVPLQPALPQGSYDVQWQVVSADGEPISGIVPFSVGDVASAPIEAPNEPTPFGPPLDEPAVEPVPVESAPVEPSAGAEPSPSVVATADAPGPSDVLGPVILGLAGTALLGALLVLVIRRRSGAPTRTPSRRS